MSNKNYRNDRYDKFQQFDDDFEDFGYEVKNIRRQTKKKVTKFKKEVDEYYDTYWSGTVMVAMRPWCCIVDKSSGIAPCKLSGFRLRLTMVV